MKGFVPSYLAPSDDDEPKELLLLLFLMMIKKAAAILMTLLWKCIQQEQEHQERTYASKLHEKEQPSKYTHSRVWILSPLIKVSIIVIIIASPGSSTNEKALINTVLGVIVGTRGSTLSIHTSSTTPKDYMRAGTKGKKGFNTLVVITTIIIYLSKISN